jgi:hypothetical protein
MVEYLPHTLYSRLMRRVDRRHVEVHEGELELNAPGAAHDLLDVGEALESLFQRIQGGRWPPGRWYRELDDPIEIEPIVISTVDNGGPDRPRSLGVDQRPPVREVRPERT